MTAAALARTARRYRVCRRFTRHYVAAKLRMDPVHEDVLALAAQEHFGRVIDIGCGYGQLGVALLEAGLADSVLGLDRRADALADARRAAAGLAFTAVARDLVQADALDSADTIMLIDVLYQLDPVAQAALLRQVTAVAQRCILIRTADPAQRSRFRAADAAEHVFRWVWPTSGAHVNAPSVDEICEALRQAHFQPTVASCSRGTPFANVLIVARAD